MKLRELINAEVIGKCPNCDMRLIKSKEVEP